MTDNTCPNNENYLHKQGIVIKQHIRESDYEYMLIKHRMDNTLAEDDYIQYFNRLKEKKTILNDSYYDNEWKFFDDRKEAVRKFTFPFEIFPSINSAMKNYILVKICIQGCKVATVERCILAIKHFMQDTGFMNPDNAKDYQLSLSALNNNNRKREAIIAREFLAYSNLDNAGIYIDLLENIKKDDNNFRKLPAFKGIMLFDYIVNDYWNNVQNSDEKYNFFPIVIWWKLTTVIPTRPVELYNLKRDCVWEKDGKYYFKLQRQKTQLDKQFIAGDIISNFEINSELYFLIKNYTDYCRQFNNEQFLLCPRTCNILWNNSTRSKKNKFNLDIMNSFYDRFLKNVVEEQYHYKVVKTPEIKDGELPYIHFGDTRHLAIMNMMQMGVNPIYIAQLAGHHSLDVQMGYYSHLETFTTAKTYILNQFMKKKHYLNDNIHKDGVEDNTKIIKKDLLGDDYYNLPKVCNGQGRCASKNVPYECNHKSCLFCKHFFPENVKDDYVAILKEENESNINITKKVLREMMRQTDLRDDAGIQQSSLQLGALLNQKILIDSYQYKKEGDI